MSYAIVLNRIGERFHNRLLTDQVSKSLRPMFQV